MLQQANRPLVARLSAPLDRRANLMHHPTLFVERQEIDTADDRGSISQLRDQSDRPQGYNVNIGKLRHTQTQLFRVSGTAGFKGPEFQPLVENIFIGSPKEIEPYVDDGTDADVPLEIDCRLVFLLGGLLAPLLTSLYLQRAEIGGGCPECSS
ncbi:hypothetical protein [Frankia gtarii]|uniref:hypothetical protein n=1 Tax=Frankia gtarii TaxID=2950102 RepID=UPI0021BF9285|nr:hypothetical protein [Frankia gtarii]